MWHTTLVLQRSRSVRHWLSHPDLVHARLAMMWPDGERDRRMLWRAEGDRILVQTYEKPPLAARIQTDWALLAEPPAFREFVYDLCEGQTYDITVRVCPAKVVDGRRLNLRSEAELGCWFGARQDKFGVYILGLSARQSRRLAFEKRPNVFMLPWDVRAYVVCRDASKMERMLRYGIGRFKAYGAGLVVVQ